MAIIGTIRKHFSVLAVVLVGLAIGAFIFSDLVTGPKGSRSNRIPTIGTVNGTDILAADYNRKVDDNLEIQRINQGVEALSAQDAFNVRVSTWNQYLNEIIMGAEYEKLNLAVTTEELFDLVQGPRPHRLISQYFSDPNTGVFNPQTVVNFLQNLDQMQPEVKKQWLNLEKYIKDDRMTQKYNTLVAKGYYVPAAFARMDYESKKKSAEMRYVGIRYTSVPDTSVALTDADYEKYYEENKHQYTQDASRDIDYVLFNVEPSADDRQKAREDFMRLYADFLTTIDVPGFVNMNSDTRYDSSWKKGSDLPAGIDSLIVNSPVGTFVPPYEENNAWHTAKLIEIASRPDSMKAEHILVSFAGSASANEQITRTKISAESRADSLLAVVKRGETPMQVLAVQYSDDPSSKENKGDLGWFADGAMVPTFNNAVAAGKVGDIVKVETQFGFHVVKITGKKDPVKKVRIAMIDRVIEPSSKTYQDIFVQASTFAGENSTKEKFDRAVEEKGLNKRSAPYIQAVSNTIAGIESPREVIRWAYHDGIEVGEVSGVFDVGEAYVVACLTTVREKGTIPLEQIRENIRNFVLNEKKAAQLTDRIGSDNDIYQIARNYNTKVDTNITLTFSSRNIPGYGSEFQVIGRVFSMNEGQVSEPIKGNGGVFVVALDRFYTPPDNNEYLTNQAQLRNSFRSRVTSGNSIYTALEKKAEIEDNRELFF